MKLPVLLAVCALAVPVRADEGLWLFNQFPKDQVRQKYSFEVSDPFLDHLRLASVRIGGGSGAFVSPTGLLLTTHRLAAGCIEKDGFYAAARQAEIKCPGLEASVLLGMEDVTKAVKGAAPASAKPADALEKRNTAMVRLEKACAEKTGNTCTVVTLFSGERYDLYQYKKYTDLRLVFAPELAIASFGGDATRFTYPRYNLDIAFLRAYDHGQPAATPQYLKWSAGGIQDGALVFAVADPTGTSRLATAAQLQFYRDSSLPLALGRLQTRIEDLRTFAVRSADNLRQAQPLLTALGTSYKLTAGKLIGLRDEWMMARKANFEKKLRTAVQRDPKLGTEGAKVWDEVATAYKNWTPFEKPYEVLESPAAEGSALFQVARALVRGKDAAPGGPIDDAVEIVLLSRYLEDVKALGDKEAPVKAILGGKTPLQAAEELVHGSKLKDAAERQRLAADRNAMQQSDDGMIRLARLLEEPARKVQKKRAELIESLETSAAERIAHYRYQVFGAADYPDATSTPRTVFGVVKAYRDRTDAPVPYATTFGGLFFLAVKQEPYRLPERWMEAKPSMDMVMPYDFASTCDMAGGGSGSPTVNQKGELVGIAFDGNIDSIAATYLYSDEMARAVHVASPGIVEALEKVYKTSDLLRELGVPEKKKSGTE